MNIHRKKCFFSMCKACESCPLMPCCQLAVQTAQLSKGDKRAELSLSPNFLFRYFPKFLVFEILAKCKNKRDMTLENQGNDRFLMENIPYIF